jgi:hypothetical protein
VTNGSDRARAAAEAVLRDLCDRSGFDHWWGEIDHDIQQEIRDDLAAVIEKAYDIKGDQ